MITAIDGFSIWNSERSGTDKGGGGLCMLYKDTLNTHEWTPPVPDKYQYIKNERQWLLVNSAEEKCAFLHTYIACQNKDNSFIQWNEDLFSLITLEAIKLRKQGFIVLAMGDFNSKIGAIPGVENNTPDLNKNTPKFLNFVNEINLLIINTLPVTKGLFTRFMDSSGRPGTKSLLDYGLIDSDHGNTVTSFIIDETARYDCGTDHALLECNVVFGHRPKLSWSLHDAIQYNIGENISFSKYQDNLDLFTATIPLTQFSSMSADQMLPHISESITRSAMKTFGLKVKKKKRGQKLPTAIIIKIKEKNRISQSLHSSRHLMTPQEVEQCQSQLDSMKEAIKDTIFDYKLHRRHRLRSKLLLADPTRKKFWRFLKGQIKSAGNITAVYDKTGKMVFDQHEIEEAVLHHFGTIFRGKRCPIFPLIPNPIHHQVDLSILELEQILGQRIPSLNCTQFEEKICSPYSLPELNRILQKLPSGKATGFDKIPNEMLKHASFSFQRYLMTFLNKVLEDGTVPQELNIGKCMLIYKV